jgi:circadian clock protein KaiC
LNDSGDTGVERVPSGVTGLDVILNGGFLKGGLYIVQGTPGTGKTTFANQLCFNHAKGGGRAVYMTLLAEYHARMMQHLATMTFFDPSCIPDKLSYISAFRTMREDGPKGLLDMVRREVVARQTSMLVLDGFANAHYMVENARELNEFFHELQGIAIATDCTMFLLSSADRVHSTPEYTIVDGIVELSDQLFGWSAESALQVVKLRGSSYLRGRHAFKITSDGLVVYPRIEALLARPSRPDLGSTEKVTSGVVRLDALLGGGLPSASTTMLMGPPGIGKTTLGLQFLAACSKAEPGLMFGFYETPARLNIKIAAVCRPLRGLIDDEFVEVIWQPPTDGQIDAYAALLLDAVHRRGVRRLFIDGLGALQNPAKPERMGNYLTALMNPPYSHELHDFHLYPA